VRPPGGDHEEGVGALDVGPAGRQRVHLRLSGLAEEDALLTPGVGVADELELLAAQGMEGMGDSEAPRSFSTVCS
jgi:hypothetical protein